MVFLLGKGRLSLKKLFLKLILPSSSNTKTEGKSECLCFALFEASFLVFVLDLGAMQKMRNQSVVVLWHHTIFVVASELKTILPI